MQKLKFDTPASAVKFHFKAAPLPPAPESGPEATSDSDGTSKSLTTLVGYAIVWNATSSDRGGYRARMLPGSARMSTDGVLALYNHESGLVLGNTANNSLRLLPDETGMRVEIDLPETTYAKDVSTLVKNGYVAGMSFGMYPGKFEDKQENGETIREYSDFEMDEVTITPLPAFVQTTIDSLYNATPHRDEQSLMLESRKLDFVTM